MYECIASPTWIHRPQWARGSVTQRQQTQICKLSSSFCFWGTNVFLLRISNPWLSFQTNKPVILCICDRCCRQFTANIKWREVFLLSVCHVLDRRLRSGVKTLMASFSTPERKCLLHTWFWVWWSGFQSFRSNMQFSLWPFPSSFRYMLSFSVQWRMKHLYLYTWIQVISASGKTFPKYLIPKYYFEWGNK